MSDETALRAKLGSNYHKMLCVDALFYTFLFLLRPLGIKSADYLSDNRSYYERLRYIERLLANIPVPKMPLESDTKNT